MIIEFLNNPIISYNANRQIYLQWTIKYKEINELYFHEILLDYEQLKLFLETYGFVTNSLDQLQKLNVDITRMVENKRL